MKFLKICIITLVLHMHIALNAFNSQDIDERGYSKKATDDLKGALTLLEQVYKETFTKEARDEIELKLIALLHAKADPNTAINSTITTLLHSLNYIQKSRSVEILTLLIESKANVNARQNSTSLTTPLNIVLRVDTNDFTIHTTAKLVQLLLSAGANPRGKNNRLNLPLQELNRFINLRDDLDPFSDKEKKDLWPWYYGIVEVFLRFGIPIQDIPYHKDRKAYIESRCKEYVDGVHANLLAVIPIQSLVPIIMDFVTSDVADETSSCVLM